MVHPSRFKVFSKSSVLRTFHMTSVTIAIAAIPTCCDSKPTHFCFKCFNFYYTTLNTRKWKTFTDIEYVREKQEFYKNVCLSANTVAKGGNDLPENKRCDLQEESKIAVHSAASDYSTNNLIFQRPNFAYANVRNRTPLEVHFVYLGNKEI
jgi:hypothetical protein